MGPSLEVYGRLREFGCPQCFGVRNHWGIQWLISEYVPGTALSAIERLTPREWLSIVLDIARTLQVLHEQSVVHGDVSPGNIVITKAGQGVLIDLGLARPRGAPLSGAGTPGFAAPEVEQLVPASASQDIYSLGALLLWGLAGGVIPPLVQDANGNQWPAYPEAFQDGMDTWVTMACGMLSANPNVRLPLEVVIQNLEEALQGQQGGVPPGCLIMAQKGSGETTAAISNLDCYAPKRSLLGIILGVDASRRDLGVRLVLVILAVVVLLGSQYWAHRQNLARREPMNMDLMIHAKVSDVIPRELALSRLHRWLPLALFDAGLSPDDIRRLAIAFQCDNALCTAVMTHRHTRGGDCYGSLIFSVDEDGVWETRLTDYARKLVSH
jgi:serine/threonine protein kinase